MLLNTKVKTLRLTRLEWSNTTKSLLTYQKPNTFRVFQAQHSHRWLEIWLKEPCFGFSLHIRMIRTQLFLFSQNLQSAHVGPIYNKVSKDALTIFSRGYGSGYRLRALPPNPHPMACGRLISEHPNSGLTLASEGLSTLASKGLYTLASKDYTLGF